MMQQFIQVTTGGTIDRYHIKNISVDNFIDNFLQTPIGEVQGISEEEYQKHKKLPLQFEHDDFQAEHYVLKHPNEDAENAWAEFIKEVELNNEGDV